MAPRKATNTVAVFKMAEAIAEHEKENPEMSTQTTEKTPRKPRKTPAPRATVTKLDADAVKNADSGSKVDLSGGFPETLILGVQPKGGETPQAAAIRKNAEATIAAHLPKVKKLLADGRASDIELWSEVYQLKIGKAHHAVFVKSEKTGKDVHPSFGAWLSSEISLAEYREISPMLAIVDYDEVMKAYLGEDGATISKRTAADIVRMWPDVKAVEARAATEKSPARAAQPAIKRNREREFAIRIAQQLGRFAWDAALVGMKETPTKQGSEGLDIDALEVFWSDHKAELQKCVTKESADNLKRKYKEASLATPESPFAGMLALLESQVKSYNASIEGFQNKVKEVNAQIAALRKNEDERLEVLRIRAEDAKKAKAEDAAQPKTRRNRKVAA